MNSVMQFLQTTFGPLVFLFTVANLAAMGLQVKMPQVVVALRNKKSLALIFVWGWVVGPALGYLITRVLPLEEPYMIVVLLASLAPCAPFRGYRFRILTAQGSAAPGGKKSYVVNGGMSGGFALVAYPAKYAFSGVMTFVVGPEGVVYQKDLGPDTVTLAPGLAEYNPDESWTAVQAP